MMKTGFGFCLGLCFSLGLAAFSGGSLAQSQASSFKPADWWRAVPDQYMMLRDITYDAEVGKERAMVPLGLMLIKGEGSQEGAKPELGMAWLKTAAERGDNRGYRYAAVMYATGEYMPRDMTKARAQVEAYLSKLQAPSSNDSCKESRECLIYRELLTAHVNLNYVAPRRAISERLGGDFIATVDVAAQTVVVRAEQGDKNLDVYGPALKRLVEKALMQIPKPDATAVMPKTLELKYSLSVSGRS